MALEIERKFLVKNFTWKEEAVPEYYCQGYIPTIGNTTVRFRTIGKKAYITIKGPTSGFARNEFEYEIPFNDAKSIIDSICIKPIIEKNRYKVSYKGMLWEVDIFEKENRGLVLAEIELEDEDQEFEKPDWIGKEVTGIARYYNATLARYPYSKWRDEEKL